ncbi:uncharacterized protein METZ01_LOCUS95062 [marine metagenome]|uniref:Uncharacterized protein n=1 Tax=marine metagenome TaxID=408172 RepID=A0A381VR29_9ZZZZ
MARLRIVIAIMGGTDTKKNLMNIMASNSAELVLSPVVHAV